MYMQQPRLNSFFEQIPRLFACRICGISVIVTALLSWQLATILRSMAGHALQHLGPRDASTSSATGCNGAHGGPACESAHSSGGSSTTEPSVHTARAATVDLDAVAIQVGDCLADEEASCGPARAGNSAPPYLTGSGARLHQAAAKIGGYEAQPSDSALPEGWLPLRDPENSRTYRDIEQDDVNRLFLFGRPRIALWVLQLIFMENSMSLAAVLFALIEKDNSIIEIRVRRMKKPGSMVFLSSCLPQWARRKISHHLRCRHVS